ARKRDEGIGPLEHDALALVHVAGHDDFVGEVEHALLLAQEIRNDSDDLAAVLVDGDGERAHHAGRAAAIDEADPGFGKNLAKLPRRGHESGIASGARSTID